MASSIEDRRKRRALEARRDALLTRRQQTQIDLAKVRAELKKTAKRRRS